MIVKATMVVLCAAGLYASVFMSRKARRAARGELLERSVVHSERARAIGRIPNAWFGIAYYALFVVAIPSLDLDGVRVAIRIAAVCAAAFSAYLAYSLLFVTRLPCAFCWTSHAVNAALLVLVWLPAQ